MGLPRKCGIAPENKYPKGKYNLITDVGGVTVGHVTLEDEEKHIHTGVTAVLPHQGNLFREKILAGVSVINGFGKSAGLVQVEELGTIESPIILTNTFAIGTALNASVKYMLNRNDDIGISTGTVNCLAMECNDGEINDIRGLHITEEHIFGAIENADVQFEEGAVGGGTGMICFGLKGGIGSASRMVDCGEKAYTIGALVMTNFGVKGNLRIDGMKIAMEKSTEAAEETKEKGSVIILLATDIPLSERQLKRVAKRGVVGLARTGSYLGNGSGDIAVAFSTGNKIPHYSKDDIRPVKMFRDDSIDKVFEAAAEAVEEAVISSLYHAKSVKGIRGKTIHSLREFL